MWSPCIWSLRALYFDPPVSSIVAYGRGVYQQLQVLLTREKCHAGKTLKSLIKQTFKPIFPTHVISETLRDPNMFSPGTCSGKNWNLGSVAGPNLFPHACFSVIRLFQTRLCELIKAWDTSKVGAIVKPPQLWSHMMLITDGRLLQPPPRSQRGQKGYKWHYPDTGLSSHKLQRSLKAVIICTRGIRWVVTYLLEQGCN